MIFYFSWDSLSKSKWVEVFSSKITETKVERDTQRDRSVSDEDQHVHLVTHRIHVWYIYANIGSYGLVAGYKRYFAASVKFSWRE